MTLPAGYAITDLSLDHAAAVAEAYDRNREHLREWDPRRDESFYTTDGQAAAIAGQLASVQAGRSAGWVITHGDQVVGRVNLNNIVMAVFCTASVGYWVDGDHLRKGLAAAAVGTAVERAVQIGLHRLEAGTLVHNVASQRVLHQAGFEKFGTARNYLFIDGAWQDHFLYQRILHDNPL